MGQKKNYTYDTNACEKEVPDYNVDKMAEGGGHPTHSPPLSLFLVSYPPIDLVMLECPKSQMQPSTLATRPYSSLVLNLIPMLVTSTFMSLACASPPFHPLPSI